MVDNQSMASLAPPRVHSLGSHPTNNYMCWCKRFLLPPGYENKVGTLFTSCSQQQPRSPAGLLSVYLTLIMIWDWWAKRWIFPHLLYMCALKHNDSRYYHRSLIHTSPPSALHFSQSCNKDFFVCHYVDTVAENQLSIRCKYVFFSFILYKYFLFIALFLLNQYNVFIFCCTTQLL